MKRVISAVVALLAMLSTSTVPVLADDEDDMAEMQRRLNQQVLERPFDAGDQAKVEAEVKEAMEKNLKPTVVTPPKVWRPHYHSCYDMVGASYYDVRNCLFYYRYYGHYW